MSDKLEIINNIAEPIAASLGLELVDIEYLKEGNNMVLRVFIDNNGSDGLKIEHCEEVSKLLSKELDRENIIKESYILEVSSPGLERPLKKPEDYKKFKGKLVNIKTFAPVNGSKEFLGKLIGLEDGVVKIDNDKGVIEIPFSQIAKTNLAIDF